MSNKNLSPAKRALLDKWLLGELNDESTCIPRLPLNSPIPLSFPQQGQLFLELLERGTAVNNLSILLQLNGKLDAIALTLSVNNIIARHDALRTRFSFGKTLPSPEVLTDVMISIPKIDFQKFDVLQQDTEARRHAEMEVLQPFDLTMAPLIRLKLYVLSNDKHLLLLVVHHTIADGWSLGVFLRELIMYYQKFTIGEVLRLPELPIQYADYAHWQTDDARAGALQSSMLYWKKQLSGELPVLELPTDHQRCARQTFVGGTHRFVLSQALTEKLERFSRQEDSTLFMTLLAAFNILLHRYSGQDEILIGTPVANRHLPELENLIGVFINTVVLRIGIPVEPGFRALLARVRDVSLEAYSHQDLPFEKLVEELKPKRDLSRTPLFQAVFNLQNSPMPNLEIPGIEINTIEIDRGVSQFDLTLMMSKAKGECRATVEYNRDLFEPATIARMFDSFEMLLEAALGQPDCPISRLQIVDKELLHQLVYKRNETQLEFPGEICVHQLFEAQVVITPNTVAVIHGDGSLTYRELNKRANALATHLQLLGVGPDVRVGILMEKSLEIAEALLAVFKAGGAYVPIHTSFPAERVQFILNDANVKVLLTNVDAGLFAEQKVHVLNFNDIQLSSNNTNSIPINTVTPDNLAYIIYTSGSTGQPKGVMVNHSALVNFLCSMRVQPGISKDDILLSVTSISFDIAALELFLPLIVGATVVIADREMQTNPVKMGEAINRYEVSIMQATPATWQLLLDSGWSGEPGLKALCGGDVLTRKLADQLLDRVNCLWNMYGPSETTVWSSINQIQKGDLAIAIGQPIGNTQLYILDRHLQPLPIGVVGELHIGGEGLARGYLNHPDLTEEKFIPDCFSSKPGARLYKTGDRARYLPDGSIELLGRTDDQVKVNGHRVELGEIAAVLMQHPLVQEAIVITRKEISGEIRLLAYFVSKPEHAPEGSELQDFARKKLPGYMMPSSFIRIHELPLTSNGKIDRKSLPLPEDSRRLPGWIAPRNEMEHILAEIWQTVLGYEQVGIHDNFFELGGASIQSLQIVANANIAGFRLSAEAIFEHQTIAELAAQQMKINDPGVKRREL